MNVAELKVLADFISDRIFKKSQEKEWTELMQALSNYERNFGNITLRNRYGKACDRRLTYYNRDVIGIMEIGDIDDEQ